MAAPLIPQLRSPLHCESAENGAGQLREILPESHFRGPLGSPWVSGAHVFRCRLHATKRK
jgi:hypothetical protein